jgi:hypothetical protein
MSDIKEKLEHTKEALCEVECPAGLDDCVECGACERCNHDAVLQEDDLPPSWLRFIERSKRQD